MSTFYIRDMPDKLHQEWGMFARSRGMSMRAYVMLAIKAQIERDKEKYLAVQKKEDKLNDKKGA